MTFANQFIQTWNSRDKDAIGALLTPDGVYEDIALGVTHRGPAELADFAAVTARMAPDFAWKLISAFESNDHYAIEWEFSGTNTGGDPEKGLPGTQKRFQVRGASVGDLRDGKIARNVDYWNFVHFLAQQGMMPPPPA